MLQFICLLTGLFPHTCHFNLFTQVVDEIAQKIMGQVPKPLPLAEIMEKYPVKYEESMNTVLVQEVIRYNRLLKVIHSSLVDLRKALKGLVVMSQALETMFNSIYNNTVPKCGQARHMFKNFGKCSI